MAGYRYTYAVSFTQDEFDGDVTEQQQIFHQQIVEALGDSISSITDLDISKLPEPWLVDDLTSN